MPLSCQFYATFMPVSCQFHHLECAAFGALVPPPGTLGILIRILSGVLTGVLTGIFVWVFG
jgi:hypothetical protein